MWYGKITQSFDNLLNGVAKVPEDTLLPVKVMALSYTGPDLSQNQVISSLPQPGSVSVVCVGFQFGHPSSYLEVSSKRTWLKNR